jgi:hypothetical protein
MADQKDPTAKDKPQDQTTAAHGQSAAAHDPHDVRPHQDAMRQHIVDHFKAIMDKCSAILNDPNSAQTLKDEAQETYDDMVANLSKFQVKYGVTPK